MPQFQSVYSLRATTRVSLSAPAGWQLPGFDDSAWSLSSVPTQLSANNPPSPVEAVAPWVTPPTVTTTMFFRSHFTVPAVPYQPYYFEQFSPASLQTIYVNGVGMLGIGKTAILDGSSVPLVPGADVVVAGSYGDATFQWISTAEGWQAWRIVFYIPDSGGQPYAWGTVTGGVNDKGFMGTGDAATHLVPTLVDLSGGMPATIVKVASNGTSTLFLTNDGVVYGCGDNSQALALANGVTDASVHATPTHIPLGNWPTADISIGQDCAMAITRDGDVLMWGPNASGSLGRGNTLPQLSPQIERTGAGVISAGKNFAVVVNQGSSTVVSAGDNTYGQLGQGSSGAPVTSWNSLNNTNFPGGANPIELSAGDDVLLILFDSTDVIGCGRAEFGALTGFGYLSGSGANKIVSTPISLSSVLGSGILDAQQAGPLSFFTSDRLTRETLVAGDGTPYGGSGDWGFDGSATWGGATATQIYGTLVGPAAGEVVLPINVLFPKSFWNIDGLAYSGAGSQNAWAAGNSKAVFAGFGFHPNATFANPNGDGSDGLLYTWGWGGAGQMGSGADLTTNTAPISVNGLTGVVGASVCAAAVFAIAAVATAPVRRSRGWVAVIG